MTSPNFKNSAKSLVAALDAAGLSLDIYAVLNLTDALIKSGANFAEANTSDVNWRHEYLVSLAMRSDFVQWKLQEGRKILAIKELRLLVQNSDLPTPTTGWLKACKEAIEDSRVQAAAALYSNPWANDHDSEEPPF